MHRWKKSIYMDISGGFRDFWPLVRLLPQVRSCERKKDQEFKKSNPSSER